MKINVKVNNEIRKVEWLSQDEDDYHIALGEILKVFDIEGEILGVAKSSEGNYSIYFNEGLEKSPVDLGNVETDPLTGHLISLKLNTTDNSIRIKKYYIGNVKNIEFDKPIAGTGIYEDGTFTIYYPTNGIMPDVGSEEIVTNMVQQGFSATTFYPDGTISDESVYELKGDVSS